MAGYSPRVATLFFISRVTHFFYLFEWLFYPFESPPPPDGGVLPQGGAEGGDLFGHPLHDAGPPLRQLLAEQVGERLGEVQRENLKEKKRHS